MRASHLLSSIVFLGLFLAGVNSASAVPIAVTEPEVTDTITVGAQPFLPLLNADENTLYVSKDQSGTVSVIDTATNAVSATIQVGQNPVQPVLHPDGTRVTYSFGIVARNAIGFSRPAISNRVVIQSAYK